MQLGFRISVNYRRVINAIVNNLLPDPSFDDASEWAFSGSNAPTVTGGNLVFTSTGSGDVCADGNVLTTGLSYRLSFTVTNYISGNMRIRFGATSSQTDVTVTGPGTYETDVLVADGTALSFISRGATMMTISDAVLVEVTPEVTELVSNGDGSSTVDWDETATGILASDGSEFEITLDSAAGGASQTVSVTASTTYTVSVDYKVGTASSVGIRVYDSADFSGTRLDASPTTSSGSYVTESFDVTPTGSSLTLYIRAAGAAGQTAQFDNVSVVEA